MMRQRYSYGALLLLLLTMKILTTMMIRMTIAMAVEAEAAETR